MILAIGIALCGFQSTLPRGERRISSNRFLPGWIFQSTLPRGERRRRRSQRRQMIINFNPRSREGSDGSSPASISLLPQFQSTLPRGERHGLAGKGFAKHGFQSTLPRGERPESGYKSKLGSIFQSTLPRGERR